MSFSEAITHVVIADNSHEVSKASGELKADVGVCFRAATIIMAEGNVWSLSLNDLFVEVG